MGTFHWPIVIGNLDRSSIREIEAMVDTGATYTVLPSALLAEIGDRSYAEKPKFEFANGRLAELDIGQAWVSINERASSPRWFSVRMIRRRYWELILWKGYS